MKYMKLGSKPDSFQTEGNNIRFVATDLATDIIVNVGEVKFYLHKFPLLSKSACLQKLVADIDEETNEEIDIPDIPGGPSAFEICAKFCYGMTVTLNAYNVVAARCAAEYLEMHETLEKGNLIYKIEVFLNSSIFRSWKDSIIVLQTTKSLLPWSEDLKVVSHCIDSIASKASVDPSEVEWSYTYNRRKLPSENGDAQWNGVRKLLSVPKDWWVEDLCELETDSYKRVIMAIRTRGRSSDVVIGEALKAYTYRRLPGFGSGGITNGDDLKNRTLLEAIVCLLPTKIGSVSCSFLLKLLKAANMVDSSENCKKELVRRIGRQLQEASVSDLLIPSSEGDSTLYDIDTVVSILQEFVIQEDGSAQTSPETSDELQEVRSPVFISASTKLAIAKLLDSYLAEIAQDPNLPVLKFVEVAEMVSGSSRQVHDGLYRAIDTYLKEHPDLTKSEKKKICGLIDCKKLTADACMHAVQNERLPLRMVVQVLFFEQVRASAAAAAPSGGSDPPGSARSMLPRDNGTSCGSSRSAATTNTEDDWDGVPITGDLTSLKSMNLAGKGGDGGGSERSSVTGDASKVGNGKVKGVLMPKLLSKLWSGKGRGTENSSSDTSESPGGSTNPELSKSTPLRNTRHSVS
ncbi:BTB/POZ domain-containing protein NPY2-like [Iris pallida]|uniref:BTB/POZ domain-containing protein NPY2-like n=1 Tax=Iris pallida TaxID=29817 RepID=A0AAX6EYY8_IRIPA|nr:BTB/POZ domain-containing protein NPY2-like [Iris pallida]KAJ6852772.1 BTB/POZ domain-containing protein NPY2-like [Iris pallida]